MADGKQVQSPFTFVDLFAGVGGFHAAMGAYGGRCVYAVEIDPAAAAVYKRNWGIEALRDITKVANDEEMLVPEHDVLTAGFPCQPFSKSGAQKGMEETRGTLFWNILKIIERRRPTVVILENVRNLAGPRHMHEWEVIIRELRTNGYRVSDTPALFSPHQLPPERGGRPQIRERVFITATHNPRGVGGDAQVDPVTTVRDRFDGFDPKSPTSGWNLDSILEPASRIDECELSDPEVEWIEAWDRWVKTWIERVGTRPPGFPLWADTWRDRDGLLREFSGVPTIATLMEADPSLPRWKASHLANNYRLYVANYGWIDRWIRDYRVHSAAFPASRRKLEWQAQDAESLWETVMHLRPSGIRAKRATYLPALVAITQTSIIGPLRRRISPVEAARLQGLPRNFDFGTQSAAASYRQMGNGVNVGAVWHVFREHVKRDSDILRGTKVGRRIVAAVEAAGESPEAVLAAHKPLGILGD